MAWEQGNISALVHFDINQGNPVQKNSMIGID
jgi:hypothetical protein